MDHFILWKFPCNFAIIILPSGISSFYNIITEDFNGVYLKGTWTKVMSTAIVVLILINLPSDGDYMPYELLSFIFTDSILERIAEEKINIIM